MCLRAVPLLLPKENHHQINIEVVGDNENESTESFWISYSNGVNVQIPEPFNTITIENDDYNYNPSDSGFTTPLSYPGFNLVWADEFDSTALNTDDWNYETGNSGWGNEESQFYRSGDHNARVQDGYLIITAKEKDSQEHLLPPLESLPKQSTFQYGRIDIRARLPTGKVYGLRCGCLVITLALRDGPLVAS